MMRRLELPSPQRTFGRTARGLAGVALATILGSVAFAEPLSYAEAVRRVDQAPPVVIAERAVALARRQLEVTGSPLRAELGGGYTRTWGERVAAEGAPRTDLADGNFDPIRLVLTLPHLGAGPSADAEARARSDLARAEAELEAVRRGQRIEVTAAYSGALRATRSADLARAEAALAALELEAAQARFEAGAATATDVARVEAAVARAESAVHAADREAALALARLELASGAPGVTPAGALPTPEVLVRPTSSVSTGAAATLAAADLTVLDLATLRALADGVAAPDASAMLSRPDVFAAALAVAESERTAAATLRDSLPSGSLNASFARGNDRNALTLGAALDSRSLTPSVSASYDPDDGFPGLLEGGSNTAFSLGISVRIPLDVSVSAAIDAARLARERAAVQFELTIARAELDLRRLAHDVITAWESMTAAERAATLAADDAEMTQRRFVAGTLSELAARRSGLEAERALLDAERAGDAMHVAWLRYLDGLAAVPAAME